MLDTRGSRTHSRGMRTPFVPSPWGGQGHEGPKVRPGAGWDQGRAGGVQGRVEVGVGWGSAPSPEVVPTPRAMELSHTPHLVTGHRLIALSTLPAPGHLCM